MASLVEIESDLSARRTRFAGSYFGLPVKVSGVPVEWIQSDEQHQLSLSYHWTSGDGEVIVWDGIRTRLVLPPSRPGDCKIVSMLVEVPPVPGDYVLEVTGVREGLEWWEGAGFCPAAMKIRVERFRRDRSIIFVAGGAGFRNAGDEALLRVAVKICLADAKGFRVVVAANDPHVCCSTLAGLPIEMVPSSRSALFRNDAHYAACDPVFLARIEAIERLVVDCTSVEDVLGRLETDPAVDFIHAKHAGVFFEALLAARAVVIHGGGILTSSTRSRLHEMALVASIAKRFGASVFFRSHQLGPYVGEVDKSVARNMLDSASFVSTRDRGTSRMAAVSIGLKKDKIFDSIDDAIWLDESEVDEAAFFAGAGLNSLDYVCACFRWNPSVGVSARALDLFIETLDYAGGLAKRRVVLLPMGPFDMDILRKVSSRLACANSVYEPSDWFRDPVVVARGARFMVSLPHHPLIFALQNDRPVVSLVEGEYYSAKNKGSMKWFGVEDFVIDVSAPDAFASAMSLIDNIELHGQRITHQIRKAKSASFEVAREVEREFRNALDRSLAGNGVVGQGS
jgi:polysaccharide pyruvyl transferase WcaK-like protein